VTCQELVELVTEYFDGAFDEAERDRLEAHLGICPGCAHYVVQMRLTLHLVQDLKPSEQRPGVASLLDTFRDWDPARRSAS
jgi:anti-sigma factor RsiW